MFLILLALCTTLHFGFNVCINTRPLHHTPSNAFHSSHSWMTLNWCNCSNTRVRPCLGTTTLLPPQVKKGALPRVCACIHVYTLRDLCDPARARVSACGGVTLRTITYTRCIAYIGECVHLLAPPSRSLKRNGTFKRWLRENKNYTV